MKKIMGLLVGVVVAVGTLSHGTAWGNAIGVEFQATAYDVGTIPGPTTIFGQSTKTTGNSPDFEDADFNSGFGGPTFEFDHETLTIIFPSTDQTGSPIGVYEFFDVNDEIPDFGNVFVQVSNAFTPSEFPLGATSRVTFDTDHIFVNVEGLNFSSGFGFFNPPIIVLGIELDYGSGSPTIPEPASVILAMIGLGSLGFRRRQHLA